MFKMTSSDLEAKFEAARIDFYDNKADDSTTIEWTGNVVLVGNAFKSDESWIFEVVDFSDGSQVTVWMDENGFTNEDLSDFIES